MRTRQIVAALVLSTGTTLLAQDFLTEGVDNARTGWVKDEKIFTPANVGSTKLLWKLKLESTPRAMHNLFSPLIAEKVRPRRASRDRRRRRRERRFVRDRRRHRQAAVAQCSSTAARIRAPAANNTLCPVRPDRGADDGAGRPGQVHGLRGVVGWTAAPDQRGRRRGRRAAGEIHPRRRQALRAEPLQRRRSTPRPRRAAAG